MKHQHWICTRNFLCTRFWSVDFWDVNTISFFLVLGLQVDQKPCWNKVCSNYVTFYWKSAALLHTRGRWRSFTFAVSGPNDLEPQLLVVCLKDFWQLLISSRCPKHKFCRSPNICSLSHHDCTSVLKQKDVAREHGLLWWMLHVKQFNKSCKEIYIL